MYRTDGVIWEIQFHTPRTQQVKDTMHVMYEQQRVVPPGSAEFQRLNDEMRAMSAGLDENPPAGALDVGREPVST